LLKKGREKKGSAWKEEVTFFLGEIRGSPAGKGKAPFAIGRHVVIVGRIQKMERVANSGRETLAILTHNTGNTNHSRREGGEKGRLF